MRFYQYASPGTRRLGVESTEGRVADLTTAEPRLRSVNDLLTAARVTGTSPDEIAAHVLNRGDAPEVNYSALADGTAGKLLAPVNAPEVWAFGVTYMDSMRERQSESETPDVYAMVYDAERPEAFFKATEARVRAPFESVGIRADSEWDVPEPELAFVLFGGEIVGYTVGNDMSSRTIEGANPLYLPQAKVYNQSVSFGPCFVTAESIGDAQSLEVSLSIEREGREAFRGSANTSSMKRDCAYLADWLQRHNTVPDGTVVLTGTGTIPPPDFTLHEGDTVSIEIERIGTLTNPVVTV